MNKSEEDNKHNEERNKPKNLIKVPQPLFKHQEQTKLENPSFLTMHKKQNEKKKSITRQNPLMPHEKNQTNKTQHKPKQKLTQIKVTINICKTSRFRQNGNQENSSKYQNQSMLTRFNQNKSKQDIRQTSLHEIHKDDEKFTSQSPPIEQERGRQ